MQKVVGSNPISRFFANPLHVGQSASAREPETRSNHPRISPSFQALIRISAWNGLDAGRLTAIAPDAAGWTRQQRYQKRTPRHLADHTP